MASADSTWAPVPQRIIDFGSLAKIFFFFLAPLPLLHMTRPGKWIPVASHTKIYVHCTLLASVDLSSADNIVVYEAYGYFRIEKQKTLQRETHASILSAFVLNWYLFFLLKWVLLAVPSRLIRAPFFKHWYKDKF